MTRICWAVATVVMVALAAIGCGDRAPRPPPQLDCAPLTARIQRCADDFWTAYRSTARARANAIDRDVAAHAAEARATFEAVGVARLCEQERARDGSSAWQRRLAACDAERECAAWAACVAPALFDGP